MVEWIVSPEAWIALGTLIALEIVLGVDNIIFITILVSKLPENQRDRARTLGLGFAMLTRLALLFSLSHIIGLVEPLFTIFGVEVSGRDCVLILGGLFLLAKSTHEIHTSLEVVHHQSAIGGGGGAKFLSTLVQIALLDVVFSLDSVITAVGLTGHLPIMVIAIVVSVIVMLFAAGTIGRFVDSHPTLKMLALSFLMLIGFTLIAEGFDVHVPKGYVYFAMAFSIFVETLNIKIRQHKDTEAVKLQKSIEYENDGK